MRRKILTLIIIGVLSIGLVACSNKNNTPVEELPKEESQQEDTGYEKPQIEEVLFDEEVVLLLDGDIKITVQGKSKIIPGNSVGYMYEVSNMSDENIEFYVKDVEIDGVTFKTDLDEGLKMSLQSLTSFSTQLTIREITSLEDLKNTTGTFCIKTNKGIDEYEFELE